MQTDQQPKTRKKSVLREFVETILFTLLIYFLIRTFLFENYRVVGHSMDPTLDDEQYLVVCKFLYRLQEPQRGDIIVFQDPRAGDRKLIKRIIGMPGESVEIKNGQVFVDGQSLDEAYIEERPHYSRPPSKVPEGEYFVLGDNRNNSSDSHNWGTLPRGAIVGKSCVSYWPPEVWGLIPHASYGDAP
jgi:signal peptidase I